MLIAEDNDINAMLARATLLKAGHRVKVVGNGKAAVEAVTEAGLKNRFDVVLMDLHMPVMDGLDAIAAIRRHEEEMAVPPVPIMVLSADSQEKTRHTVLAHGASGFVTKPLDPDALVHAVEGQVRRLMHVAQKWPGFEKTTCTKQRLKARRVNPSARRALSDWRNLRVP